MPNCPYLKAGNLTDKEKPGVFNWSTGCLVSQENDSNDSFRASFLCGDINNQSALNEQLKATYYPEKL